MAKFQIEGGLPLQGEITAGGNKNAALPMLAATLLTAEEVVLENVPRIRDVTNMLAILEHLGASVAQEGGTVRVQAADLREGEIGQDLARRVRTSFLCIGPLLHRLGQVRTWPPGGDVIGRRRLDAHLYGLRCLGAEVDEQDLRFSARNGLAGRELFFDEASVTATEHILMAAVVARGRSIIRNAASEPHVQDLAHMLCRMGARIQGIGTDTLLVDGVASLHGVHYRVRSDHIEVGSFLALAAATGGSVTIHDVVFTHYWMIRRVFQRFGLNLTFTEANTVVSLPPGQDPHVQPDAGNQIPRIDDGPWPQFPSDLMSSLLVLATQSRGTVLFFEKMFESRMYFVDYLIQMGASVIVCDPHRVVINGPTPLRAVPVRSPDIRAGMALLSATLCATGQGSVDNVEIIDRGYEHVEQKLLALGARIRRVD